MRDDEPGPGDVTEAQPGQVTFTISWAATDDGALTGQVRVRNVAGHPVRISGKPDVTPRGLDGLPLAVSCVVTLELRLPGYVDLDPGQDALAPVRWFSWDGPPAGDRVRIRWPGGEADAEVTGPRQPDARDRHGNLTSSWFTPA